MHAVTTVNDRFTPLRHKITSFFMIKQWWKSMLPTHDSAKSKHNVQTTNRKRKLHIITISGISHSSLALLTHYMLYKILGNQGTRDQQGSNL
jgi:hypothetical protein